MLASTSESRSINISSMNESGAVVLASHGSYAERHINISFDLLDAEYCASHKAEIESAITAFLSRFNELLSDNELPQVNP